MSTVSIDDADIFYTTRGSGPACLVPSAVGTVPYERQVPSQLSDWLQLVFVDLRGGGRSTGDPADLTFDQVTRDFEAVRAALGADRVAVLGHSIIGVLAIEYGRRRPATVSHVIAVGTPPRGDMSALQAAATAFFQRDASETRQRILQENLAALPPGTPPAAAFLAQAPTRFFDPRTDMGPLYEGAIARPALLEHLLGALTRDWDITHGPAPLRTPILLAHGRYDYTVPCELWDGIEAVLPTAERQIFHRSGHQPFFEEPDRFSEVLAEWMTRTPAASD